MATFVCQILPVCVLPGRIVCRHQVDGDRRLFVVFVHRDGGPEIVINGDRRVIHFLHRDVDHVGDGVFVGLTVVDHIDCQRRRTIGRSVEVWSGSEGQSAEGGGDLRNGTAEGKCAVRPIAVRESRSIRCHTKGTAGCSKPHSNVVVFNVSHGNGPAPRGGQRCIFTG